MPKLAGFTVQAVPPTEWPLDYQIPHRMAAYLSTANLSDPPLAEVLAWLEQPGTGAIGLIQAGRYQEDPRTDPQGVVTIHVGDAQDLSWRHEALSEQRGVLPGEQSIGRALLGGYREIGGGALWWQRYTALLQYFATETGDDQATTNLKATTVLSWLSRYISRATPKNLGLVANQHEMAQEVALMHVMPLEGGGPPDQYVWRARLHFQVLVHKA